MLTEEREGLLIAQPSTGKYKNTMKKMTHDNKGLHNNVYKNALIRRYFLDTSRSQLVTSMVPNPHLGKMRAAPPDARAAAAAAVCFKVWDLSEDERSAADFHRVTPASFPWICYLSPN